LHQKYSIPRQKIKKIDGEGAQPLPKPHPSALDLLPHPLSSFAPPHLTLLATGLGVRISTVRIRTENSWSFRLLLGINFHQILSDNATESGTIGNVGIAILIFLRFFKCNIAYG